MASLGTGVDLARYLDSVMEEGVKSALAKKAVQEKEKQLSTASKIGSGDASGKKCGSSSGVENEGSGDDPGQSKTMSDQTDKMKSGDIESDDIVGIINTIRAGKSFKDENVSSAMEEYVDSLKKPEKVALMAFLKGIAQITTGEVAAKNAIAPDKAPVDVKMKMKDAQNVKHIKPNIIKSVSPDKKGEKSKEDASGPVPITPKRKQ